MGQKYKIKDKQGKNDASVFFVLSPEIFGDWVLLLEK